VHERRQVDLVDDQELGARQAGPALRTSRSARTGYERAMPSFTGTVTSPKPVSEVFPYMADFSNTKDWDPNITETSVTSAGDPVRVGATFHVVQGSGLTKVELDYETVELVDGQKVVLRAETDSLVSIETITVAPEGAGSSVTYDVEITLKGARKVAEPIMALLLKRIGDEARDGLQQQLG
jgi:hypothetical protein